MGNKPSVKSKPTVSVEGKFLFVAGVAQLVEHNLAKVGVAGSNPVSRSNVNLKKGPSVSLSGLLGPGLLKYGSLVEMVTMSSCHGEGHGFESRTNRKIRAVMYQGLAFLPCKERVVGSIPTRSTMSFPTPLG